MDRRAVLALLVAAGGSARSQAAAQDGWFALTGDDGRPVSNLRLPVELTSEVDELPGVIWTGSQSRALTVVEFFDYNCPYCRAAATDIHALVQAEPELRVGLINNPILSPQSVEAAKVELALLQLGQPGTVERFHRRLFERRGIINGPKALEVAEEVGAPGAQLEERAAGRAVQEMLSRQMRLAASLGFAATPSFLIAGAGVLGYPGPGTLRRMLDAVRRCDQIVC